MTGHRLDAPPPGDAWICVKCTGIRGAHYLPHPAAAAQAQAATGQQRRAEEDCLMDGPEHYRTAEEFAERAGAVMDADWGIYAGMGFEERIQRRTADLAAAQVHATLALAAATADPFEAAGAWAKVLR